MSSSASIIESVVLPDAVVFIIYEVGAQAYNIMGPGG